MSQESPDVVVATGGLPNSDIFESGNEPVLSAWDYCGVMKCMEKRIGLRLCLYTGCRDRCEQWCHCGAHDT